MIGFHHKLAFQKVAGDIPPTLNVTSPAFAKDGPLPKSATVEGEGRPPALAWSNVPRETKSIVVLVEDPDAPFPEPYVHWMVYGIAPNASFGERYNEGKNSKLAIGFTPAEPPRGHGLHHYHFEVFALDTTTDYDPGIGRSELLEQMKGHVLGWGEVVGTYERS